MSEQKLREALEKLVARAKNAREYRDGRWVAFYTSQEEQVLAVPAPEPQGVRLTGEMVQNAVGKFGADQPWCNAVARKLNAALTASPATVAQQEEIGWLIERKNPAPEYLSSLDVPATWTQDSLEAIRFARRKDAEKVAVILENEDISIEEHGWS